MPNNLINIAVVQMRCTDDWQQNVDKAVDRIADAAANGANIICLQELFTSLYPCQSEDHTKFDLAEPLDGPTCQMISETAAKHEVVVIASIFERRTAGIYHNTAVVFDADGSQAGVYHKMHIPDDPSYYEKFYFTPGDLGFQAIQTRYAKIGVCICWDQWFPEAARLTALAGAEVLFFPTAIGWLHEEKQEYGPAQVNAWETMMRSHAIANGIFVAAPNRVGIEDNIQFWGHSFIADPNGNLLGVATHDHEETLVVECNLQQIDVVRTHWPFLRDRRIDAYDGLTQRFLDGSSEEKPE
ncbi:MAG: carbon-nitrogen hydrolase [Pirellulales bacterium]|jgi:N-carbamoylputrescine amidase